MAEKRTNDQPVVTRAEPYKAKADKAAAENLTDNAPLEVAGAEKLRSTAATDATDAARDVDDSDEPSERERLAESTTSRVTASPTLDQPETIEEFEAYSSARLTEDVLTDSGNDGGHVGPVDDRPSQEELEEQLDYGLGAGQQDAEAPDDDDTGSGSKESMIGTESMKGPTEAQTRKLIDDLYQEKTGENPATATDAEKQRVLDYEIDEQTGFNDLYREQTGKDPATATVDEKQQVLVNAANEQSEINENINELYRKRTGKDPTTATDAEKRQVLAEEPGLQETAAQPGTRLEAAEEHAIAIPSEDAPPTENEVETAEAFDARMGRNRGDPRTDNASQPVEGDDDTAFGAGAPATETPTGLAAQGSIGLFGQPGPDDLEAYGGGSGASGPPIHNEIQFGADGPDQYQATGPVKEMFSEDEVKMDLPSPDQPSGSGDTGGEPLFDTTLTPVDDGVPDDLVVVELND